MTWLPVCEKNLKMCLFVFDRMWNVTDGRTDRQTDRHRMPAKGPFIATQLNSTSSWVELRRRSVYSDADATQLNWTQLDVESIFYRHDIIWRHPDARYWYSYYVCLSVRCVPVFYMYKNGL